MSLIKQGRQTVPDRGYSISPKERAVQDIDRIQEANAHLERRARQREAAALAQQQLTPEAIEAEKERNRVQAALERGEYSEEDLPTTNDMINDAAVEEMDEEGSYAPESLVGKLSAALQDVLQPPADEPVPLALGRLVFQWVLVASDEGAGHQLALQIQVDEQPPAGFVADITPEVLAAWAKGKGLQGNRTEHKHFAAGLFDRAIGVGATETTNGLIYALEQLMLGEPTRTSVGDDEADSRSFDNPAELAEYLLSDEPAGEDE